MPFSRRFLKPTDPLLTPDEQPMDSPPVGQPPLGAKYVSIERRSPSETVFMVDDTPFRSTMPQATHWSIAWSDLMMTMFILFLSMFVYQSAHRKFISQQKPEILGGTTNDALETDRLAETGLPFAPISPGLPLTRPKKNDTNAPITLKKVDVDSVFAQSERPGGHAAASPAPGQLPPVNARLQPHRTTNPSAILLQSTSPSSPPVAEEGGTPSRPRPTTNHNMVEPRPLTATGKNVVQPRPLTASGIPAPKDNQIDTIYRLSEQALKNNNLQKFASIQLVPDRTVRIVLTSDLMFATGRADLSLASVASLEKLASAIRNTPYMINVVGHTDNVPMHSSIYPSNWELSLARASTVARFLIDDMGMNPRQFVVSGYASYRPLRPNTNATNRARNRRVEIIISKHLPQARAE